ncbi:MAG: type I-E CRISPR-associated endonuclease Cas1 [Polyangiaceae bacterium]|nr:type I-E CRISPR-associated endonuclease Cas1 [Polyangiaceae bacterium]
MNERVVFDLAQLPRVSDGWTFLYTEHARIERADYAIELFDAQGRVPVPVASLSVLLLGPGTTVTHAAMLALAESGCSVVWCGEGTGRFYASGIGETRRGHHLEAQATAWASSRKHLEVVRRLYSMRFPDGLPEGLSLEQIRGYEGVRVRDAYADVARETGVPWNGRAYKQGDWASADPVNRALSAANACLYGLCHAAIVATGFCPGLGFIHTGKLLSFVYDVADLYKVEVTVPVAFHVVQGGVSNIESRARKACREAFLDCRILERIVPDMQRALGLLPEKSRVFVHRTRSPPTGADGEESGMGENVGALWNPRGEAIAGGRNFGEGLLGATPAPPDDAEADDQDEEVPF